MGRTLTRRLIVFLFFCAGVAAFGQGPNDNPVAQIREGRSWEMGPFGYWGTGLGDRDNFKFFAAGLQLGKVVSPVVHAEFSERPV